MDWMPLYHMVYDRMHGKPVYTADERPIGVITELLHPVDTSEQAAHAAGHCLVIKGAAGRPPPLYVSAQAMQAVEPDRVVLEPSADEIARSGWNEQPPGFRYR